MSFNIASINQAIAAAIPNREAIVFGDRRISYGQLAHRTNRLANVLIEHGISIHRERDSLENWECGQDRVALYLYNGNEYLEGMLGAFKARAVPFNVNYRYVAAELRYLFEDAGPRALIVQRRFAPVIRETLGGAAVQPLILQVEDGSGVEGLANAIDYETALANASGDSPNLTGSPDDIYLLYTGGTTGMPKGVLWRQADSVVAQLAGRNRDGSLVGSLDDFASRARNSPQRQIMPIAPFMHGAGCYMAFAGLHNGNTVVVQSTVEHFDAHDVLATIERERVSMFLLIGDAFGRPLLDTLANRAYDVSSVRVIYNSGAILSAAVKQGLCNAMPRARIVDGLGSSETGPQATLVTGGGIEAPAVANAQSLFSPTDEAVILADDHRTVLQPGHDGYGWLAKRGSVPLGYLGDRERTQATFPILNGERHVVSGDRVRWLASTKLEFLGRDSFTVNSGGEKIFVEEVERALFAHPDVADVVVSDRPSDRWGRELVALVALRPLAEGDETAILDFAARQIARYKLPKAIVHVPEIRRGANGKADYRWAKRIAEGTVMPH